MSKWKEFKLGELAEITSSKRIFYSDYVLSGIPFYRSKEVIEKALGQTTNEALFISVDKFTEIKEKFGAPENGDLLVSAVGERAGIPYLVKDLGDFYFKDGNLIWLRNIKADLVAEFFCYWLRSNLGQHTLESIMIGSAQKALTIIGLKNLSIRIPLPSYQKYIASVLSSLDDKIDLLQRQNTTSEAMAETLFRQWFVVEAREEWSDTTLEEHIEAFRGLSYKGSGLTEKGMGLPMHNLNSVYEGGGYKYEGIKFYHGEYRERHLISPGDIIVTNTEQGHEFRLIGFPAIVPDDFGAKGLFSQHIYKLAPLPTTYLSKPFIYYLLMSASVREQIISATNGSTVNMLAIDGLQRPEFKLPPKEKVVAFTAIVDGYWKKKSINHKQIRTLTALRNTLLPKLMSGEVRVKM